MTLPELPLAHWTTTIHLWAQIVGKTRLALMPRRNHWWQVPSTSTTTPLASRARAREETLASHAPPPRLGPIPVDETEGVGVPLLRSQVHQRACVGGNAQTPLSLSHADVGRRLHLLQRDVKYPFRGARSEHGSHFRHGE